MTDDLPPLPIITPGRWRHYKGLDYEVLGVVRHSETLEPLVLYRPLYRDSGTWVRPYAMFLETVEVQGQRRARFECLEPEPSRQMQPDAPADDGGAGSAATESTDRPDIQIQDPPQEWAVQAIDSGLGAFNEHAAALHEVKPLACVARLGQGRVIAGAVGRLWRGSAELQQLWVEEPARGRGLGRAVLEAFEGAARARGAQGVFLETFSFQAPGFYGRCGYALESSNVHYPHGIEKHRYFKALNGS